ncbi:MAG TPA: peptidoglycan DD-metalloendopeptidase family protein [Candidatus Paceibacterota bacterium]
MPARFLKISLVIVLMLTLGGRAARSQTSDDISGKIADTNSQIKSLEAEIAAYSKSLTETQKAGNTLANAIKTLDLTKKKLDAQSKLTGQQVEAVTLQIGTLGTEIGVREQKITQHLIEISSTVRELRAEADASPIQVFLSQNSLSGALDQVYNLQALQEKVRLSVVALKEDKQQLTENKIAREGDKAKLIVLRARLIDQQKLTEQNRKDKASLLAQTKNKEANYKLLLEQKIVQKAQFEADLLAYETKLKTTINFANLPKYGSGVLAWPLDEVLITQKFGDTEFAKAGAYNGKGHNGIDLRASLGTTVKSAASGTVTATGNTDLGCPSGSYGNWVLVDHGTGLSTLYAHLSLIKVTQGDSVPRSGLIGYSGSTGYSTGPHLHFAVYATQGVKVAQLYRGTTPSKCPPMPVASLNAYLNPLLYL